MPKSKLTEFQWLATVEAHNYPAAHSYLSLVYDPKRVTRIISGLKVAPIVEFKSKDIFRASQLSLLGVSNSHVAKDKAKIRRGQGLSPLLLVRDEGLGKVVIADGYHRLCAIYDFNEDALIRCKIV
jgi:disulfide oxidoreductase YuzD